MPQDLSVPRALRSSSRRQRHADSPSRATRDRQEAADAPAWQPRRAYVVAAVCTLTIAAAALHLGARQMRPLWVDEASTYWTSRYGWLALVAQVGTDGSPPLYFLVVKAVTAVFGTSEFALRLPSLAASVALIPALYTLGKRLGSVRTGLLAATLGVLSPLVHYYGAETRMYAVLQLETAVVALAWLRTMERPTAIGRWAMLCLAEVLQLSTHVYAVFLLPCLPIVTAFVAPRKERVRSTGLAALTTLVAFAMCAVWLRSSVENAQAGIGDWIVPLWNDLPPSMAVIRSLTVFGFGADYPHYLWLPKDAPNIGAWTLVLSLGVLAAAVIGVKSEKHHTTLWAVAALLCLPLVGAWCYSWLSVPLYLPGRYDTIVLPIFLVLFAVGLDRIWRWRALAGGVLTGGVAILAVLGLSSTLDPAAVPVTRDVAAGHTLARVATETDRVVAAGLRQQVTWYYARRSGFRGTIRTFPTEVDGHPGWESPARMLADPGRLQQDAESLTGELVAAARQGHRVWVLPTARGPVNDFFFPLLFREMEPDPALTFQDAGLVGLRLR